MVVDSMKTATIIGINGEEIRVNVLDCGTLSGYQKESVKEKCDGCFRMHTKEFYDIVCTPLLFNGEMGLTFRIIFPKPRKK